MPPLVTVPLPDLFTVKVKLCRTKVAETEASFDTVTVQLPVPPQPAPL